MIDGHGDDLWRYGTKVKHNFSTNIHSAFDHTPLMIKLAESMSAVTSYPEPKPISVEKKLADINHCQTSQVMATNGATEAIYIIAKTFSKCRSAIFAPSFREYQDACKMYDHSTTFFNSILNIPADSDLVWLCNPNNPTGNVIPITTLRKTVEANQSMIFIIDQAYSDYTSLPVISAKDAVNMSNVILLGSMTKRFAVPGLRIGHAISNYTIIKKLKQWRMPWSISGLAIKGASYLLDNIHNYPIDAVSLHAEALRISSEFERMGIHVYPTDCNFILCRLPKGSAADLKDYLICEAGILIRNASNFESLDETYFRVAAQTTEENNLLIEYVKKWLDI